MAQADEWTLQFDAATKVSSEVSSLISEKLALEASKSSTAKVKAYLRRKLEQLKDSYGRLDSQLQTIEANPAKYGIGTGEVNRRMRLILDLKQQLDRAEEALEGRKKAGGPNRTGLGLDNDASRSRKIEETEYTQGQTSQQLYDDHKKKLEENDRALDQIHGGVIRIKNIASGMNNELDLQKKLLDDVDDSMDKVNKRLKNDTKLAKDVGEKAKTGWMFWIMILLIGVIVVLIFVPGAN